MQPYDVFKEISNIERSHRWLAGKNIQGVADPAIWDAETGESIAEVAEKYRIHFEKADNSRLNGWMQCHYRLAFDDEQKPMVYFFNTCKHAIRTLPMQMYSEIKIEDLDTKLEDHFADSFRYFCMSRPLKPQRAQKAVELPYNDPLNLIAESMNKRYGRF